MEPIRNIETQLPGAPVTTQQAQDLKSKIQDALVEIQQARQYDEYYDMQEAAEIETLEAKLKASLVTINVFLATGQWPEGGIGQPVQNQSSATPLFRDVQPGWNGDAMLDANIPAGYGNVQGLVPGGAFQGFVYINDSGDPAHPPQLVFEASPTSIKIEAFNRGKDVVYVETYLDPQGREQKRFWIGKDHVTNTRANIIVTAHNLDHGIKMDFHGAYRISDTEFDPVTGVAKVAGYNLFGSDFNDQITGSQGQDLIRGFKGNDTLFGEGEKDTIFGDDGIWNNGQTDPQAIREQLGMRTDLNDGNDTIDGGAGTDQVYGDGGVDSGYDKASGPDAEHVNQIEQTLTRQTLSSSDRSWFVTSGANQSRGWGDVRHVEGGFEISQTGTDENTELTLRMPDGYDYATGQRQADGSIKITFVKHVEGGVPQSFFVIVKGALSNRTNDLESPFTLKILGNGGANIIDFHAVDMENNNFIVDGAASNDMVLAPINELNKQGLSVSDLLGTANRVSNSAIEDAIDTVIPDHDSDDWQNSGIQAVRTGNEIVLSRPTASGDNPLQINIDPADFNKAYVLVDPEHSSDLLVVLVKPGVTGGSPQTLVIRIRNYSNFQGTGNDLGNLRRWLSIHPTGAGADAGGEDDPSGNESGFDWIPIITTEIGGRPVSGNIINGGAGDDFVYYLQGDEVTSSPGDSTVMGEYNNSPDLPVIPPGGGNGGDE